MGEAGATAGNDVEVAGDIELADFELFEPAVFDFPGDAHARNNGNAHAHLHEALDAFDGGHFHGHVEGRAMAREELDHSAAEGRFDDMSDKIFFAEFLDLDFAFLGKRMLGRNNQGEFVFEDFGGLELRIARHKGNGAEIESIVDDFVRNIAREHAMETYLDAGMGFAEAGEGGEEGVDGAFVDAKREFAALESFELHEALFDLVAEVKEALGVFAEEGAGVGKADGAGAADKQGLGKGILEFADSQADGGLGAVEAFSRAGETAFACNSQENLQFT